MDKWRCIPCDYICDPALGEEGGIVPGTAFEKGVLPVC